MFSNINEKNKMQQYVFKSIFIISIIVSSICFFSKQYFIGNKIIDFILVIFTGALNIICNDIANKKKYSYSNFLGVTSIIITLTQIIILLIFELNEEVFFINLM
ncbi:hypothetical protein, partial [Clostridium tarantellae]